MFLQPFDSFEILITRFYVRDFLGLNYFLINSTLILILIFLILLFFIFFILRDSLFIINFLRYFLSNLIVFALNQIKNQVGYQGTPWLSLFIFYFLFILFSDYIGLLPFSFTLTSQFNYVLIPTMSVFLGLTIRVLTDNFKPFIYHFVPSGIPLIIGIFLFFIEIVSYFFRAISLPVRVFANMVAGHVLLFLMATALIINYEVLRGMFLKLSLIFILFLWFCVFHLELLVAYLQAYVFLTMISIYAKDLGVNRKKKRIFLLLVNKCVNKIKEVDNKLKQYLLQRFLTAYYKKEYFYDADAEYNTMTEDEIFNSKFSERVGEEEKK